MADSWGDRLRQRAEAAAAEELYQDPAESLNQQVQDIVKAIQEGKPVEEAVKSYRQSPQLADRAEGGSGGIITRLQALGYDVEIQTKKG